MTLTDPRPATKAPTPKAVSLVGPQLQRANGSTTPSSSSRVGSTPPQAIEEAQEATSVPPAGEDLPAGAGGSFAVIALLAANLDDMEKARKAAENRKGSLARVYGAGPTSRDYLALSAVADGLRAVEHAADLALCRAVRRHPLHPWIKATPAIAEKSAGRLLAATGDPYIRPQMLRADGTVEPSRPRTVSELWAYCGYKPGQRLRRGEQANWNGEAKMRAYLLAENATKATGEPFTYTTGVYAGRTVTRARSPYRDVYDKRRTATANRTHNGQCVRCGPSGHPAADGTPWNPAHQQADALRIVAKTILRDLWRESKRLHDAN